LSQYRWLWNWRDWYIDESTNINASSFLLILSIYTDIKRRLDDRSIFTVLFYPL
jgi:hypothetical protein